MTREEKKKEVKDLLQYVDITPLSNRQRKVLSFRYDGEGNEIRTLKDIGKEFGVGKERIRQIQEAALRKLRFYRGKA